jgi:hypothetical protein
LQLVKHLQLTYLLFLPLDSKTFKLFDEHLFS